MRASLQGLKGEPAWGIEDREKTSLATCRLCGERRVEAMGQWAKEGWPGRFGLDPEAGQSHRNDKEGISCLQKKII